MVLICVILSVSFVAYSFPALDEGDIELLKTYVSTFAAMTKQILFCFFIINLTFVDRDKDNTIRALKPSKMTFRRRSSKSMN